jgi:hypothetical protein
LGAGSAAGRRVHVAVLDVDLGAHRLEALHVLVHGARTDRATPGQRHARAPAAGKERPEHQDGRAHGLHQLVPGGRLLDLARAQLQAPVALRTHLHAHLAEKLRHGAHVHQARHVLQRERLFAQQGRAQDGQGRVLCSRDAHFAGERTPAGNPQLIHRPPALRA